VVVPVRPGAPPQDQTQPPEPAIEQPFNTHFDYLRDRRAAAAVAPLGDALSRL
jgi:hypothetical protein